MPKCATPPGARAGGRAGEWAVRRPSLPSSARSWSWSWSWAFRLHNTLAGCYSYFAASWTRFTFRVGSCGSRARQSRKSCKDCDRIQHRNRSTVQYCHCDDQNYVLLKHHFLPYTASHVSVLCSNDAGLLSHFIIIIIIIITPVTTTATTTTTICQAFPIVCQYD